MPTPHIGWCVFNSRGRIIKADPRLYEQVAGGIDLEGRSIFEFAARPDELHSQFSRVANEEEIVSDVTELKTPDGPLHLPHTYFPIPKDATVGCCWCPPYREPLDDLEVECLKIITRGSRRLAAKKMKASISSIGRLIRSAKKKLRAKSIREAIYEAAIRGLI
jgi:DNA-binding CsgD family transcriptional regulator